MNAIYALCNEEEKRMARKKFMNLPNNSDVIYELLNRVGCSVTRALMGVCENEGVTRSGKADFSFRSRFRTTASISAEAKALCPPWKRQYGARGKVLVDYLLESASSADFPVGFLKGAAKSTSDDCTFFPRFLIRRSLQFDNVILRGDPLREPQPFITLNHPHSSFYILGSRLSSFSFICPLDTFSEIISFPSSWNGCPGFGKSGSEKGFLALRCKSHYPIKTTGNLRRNLISAKQPDWRGVSEGFRGGVWRVSREIAPDLSDCLPPGAEARSALVPANKFHHVKWNSESPRWVTTPESFPSSFPGGRTVERTSQRTRTLPPFVPYHCNPRVLPSCLVLYQNFCDVNFDRRLASRV